MPSMQPNKEMTMSKIKSIRKAIVAVLGVVVAYGILDQGTAQDVAGVLTAILVYLVPNETA